MNPYQAAMHYLATIRARLREPSSLAAIGAGFLMLKDWAPNPALWYVAQGVVGVILLAAVLMPERK